jgi:hypothetical protein
MRDEMKKPTVVSQETIPDKVLARQNQLYEAFLIHALKGTARTRALQDKKIPRQTFDRWRKQYPDWIETIHQQALADAIEIRRQSNQDLNTARLTAQEEIENLVLPQSPAIAQELIDIALRGARETSRISAIRELGTMLRDGWAYRKQEEQPRQAEPGSRLAYNPNTQDVQDMGLRLPPGSEVTITARTPDPVLDLPSLPRDRDAGEGLMGHETP